jgi:hypothetical protein
MLITEDTRADFGRGPWVSPVFGLIARAVIILVLMLGLSVHIIPPVVGLLRQLLATKIGNYSRVGWLPVFGA